MQTLRPSSSTAWEKDGFYKQSFDKILAQMPPKITETPNLLRRATMGQTEVHAKVRCSSIFHSQHTCVWHTRNGLVEVSEQLPNLARRYKVLSQIARGTFSQIVRAVDLHSGSGRVVAIKILKTGFEVLGMRELSLLLHLRAVNPHCKMHFTEPLDWFSFEQHMCIVMPEYQHSLLSLVKPKPSQIVKQGTPHALPKTQIVNPRPVRQSYEEPSFDSVRGNTPADPGALVRCMRIVASKLLHALSLLHEQNIIHADIKPENILLNSTTSPPTPAPVSTHMISTISDLRLIDFGNAIHLTETSEYMSTFELQTLAYRAPEVLLGCPFDTKIDMWSVGVLLVEIFRQEPLFDAVSREQLFEQLRSKLQMVVPDSLRQGRHYADLVLLSTEKKYRARDAYATHLAAVGRLLPRADDVCLSFVAALLQPEPSYRMDAKTALRHPFLLTNLYDGAVTSQHLPDPSSEPFGASTGMLVVAGSNPHKRLRIFEPKAEVSSGWSLDGSCAWEPDASQDGLRLATSMTWTQKPIIVQNNHAGVGNSFGGASA